MTYEIIGIGAPVVDQILMVSDEFLDGVSGSKGGQCPVDLPVLEGILEKAIHKPYKVPGGSATNTIKGLANLGKPCALIGKAGKDAAGAYFFSSLSKQGVIPLLYESIQSATSQVLCLVTPDGERTMRSHLAASTELDAQDLDPKAFSGCKLLYVEGYCLYNQPLALRAMQLAKEVGARVALDLASFEIVQAYRVEILDILEKFVDIVFSNSQEAQELFNLKEQETAKELAKICDLAIVSMNCAGCWAASRQELAHYPAYPVKPVDTTGAGDLFAAGFLYGVLEGRTLQESAHYGALLGKEIVQHVGAEIPEDFWVSLREKITPA